MGISVKLNVYWDDVEPQAWAAAYDETWRLLRSHPSQLMGYTWRSVFGRKVPFYAKDIEQRDGDDPYFLIRKPCSGDSLESGAAAG